MKLYILRPIEGKPAWEPWFDKAFGFIVSADSETVARKLADEKAGDENRDGDKNPWLDPEQSTCTELVATDKNEVIMRDFAAA